MRIIFQQQCGSCIEKNIVLNIWYTWIFSPEVDKIFKVPTASMKETKTNTQTWIKLSIQYIFTGSSKITRLRNFYIISGEFNLPKHLV